MAINFSNVNISLRQFHEIASGKYNAGDIKLTSETEIDNVVLDEESKSFRQLVSLVFLMLNQVNRADMDVFDKVKSEIGKDLEFSKKGWILFEAMERTSDRIPRAE